MGVIAVFAITKQLRRDRETHLSENRYRNRRSLPIFKVRVCAILGPISLGPISESSNPVRFVVSENSPGY